MAFEDWFIARARVSSKPHKRITLDDKMTFFQQLSTLVSSGTPLLQAMQICAEQSQSLKLQPRAGSRSPAAWRPAVPCTPPPPTIRTSSSTTGSRSSAPAKSPDKWAPVLLELNKQIRETRETHRKVSGAMMYPMILDLSLPCCAVTAMLWLVVPTFAKMFKDMGAELPGITQFVVDLSDFIVHYGLYVLSACIVAVVLAFRQYLQDRIGAPAAWAASACPAAWSAN